MAKVKLPTIPVGMTVLVQAFLPPRSLPRQPLCPLPRDQENALKKLMLLAGLSLAACQAGGDRTVTSPKDGEWPGYGRTYDEQRYAPLAQITASNVGKLGVAWWSEFDTDRGQEASPLIVDGVLYTSTAWSKVFAFDAKTGKALWSYDPKVPGEKGRDACCDVVNRGVAIWKDRVFVGALDGRLIALDAKTGKPAWSVQTTDVSKPYTITGAPRVVKGKVLIGNGGAEYGVRGYVSAYDARDGKLAWRFYTTPNPGGRPDGAASDAVLKAKADATWSEGAWRQTGGGGTVWDAITYDPKSDLVYVGVGNGTPWNHKLRSGGKGDNLFLSSIVALKPETGEYVWHYQTTPGESWDYTATQQIMVADLPLARGTRRVVMQAPKNGFFYVLDARTGELISAEKYVPVDWAERVDLKTGRPVEAPGARYPAGTTSHQMTNGLGGHNWQPMSFSPKTGLVYIPTMQKRGNYSDAVGFRYTPGAWNHGQNWTIDRPGGRALPQAMDKAIGELVAWDPAAGRARWRVRLDQFWTGGTLATAGDLVFQSAGAHFVAYEAATGRPVWSYDTGAPAVAAPVAYALDGEQYVALMVGWGGAAGMGLDLPRRPGRLLVFRLGGQAKPTPYPEPFSPPPLDLGDAEASTGDADKGSAHFVQFCQVCHRGGVFLPNLSRTPAILSATGFRAIVLDGALAPNGMPPFKTLMSPQDAEDLRAFLLWRAAQTTPAAPAGPNHGG